MGESCSLYEFPRKFVAYLLALRSSGDVAGKRLWLTSLNLSKANPEREGPCRIPASPDFPIIQLGRWRTLHQFRQSSSWRSGATTSDPTCDFIPGSQSFSAPSYFSSETYSSTLCRSRDSQVRTCSWRCNGWRTLSGSAFFWRGSGASWVR